VHEWGGAKRQSSVGFSTFAIHLFRKTSTLLRQSMGHLVVDNEPRYRYVTTSDTVSVKRGLRFRSSHLLKDEERLEYLLELAKLRRRYNGITKYLERVIRSGFMVKIAQDYSSYEAAKAALAAVEAQEPPFTTNLVRKIITDVFVNDIKVEPI